MRSFVICKLANVCTLRLNKTAVCLEYEVIKNADSQDLTAYELVIFCRFPTSFLSILTQLIRFVLVCFPIVAPEVREIIRQFNNIIVCLGLCV